MGFGDSQTKGCLSNAGYQEFKMGKFGWAVIFFLCAAYAADQYWYYGYYADNTMAMLRQIRSSFGW